MKKIIFAGVMVLLALFLVTCDDWLNPPVKEEGEIEYFDWKYEDMPNGTGRLTLMLDGSSPFAHVKQSQRALSEGLAKMAHDYFEAVFMSDTGAIARASWEIGMPAGISGVKRDIDYADIMPDSDGAAVIFVGKKTGKTLLGIGHVIKVDEDLNETTIAATSKSVTFGVYPLITEGLTFDDIDSLGAKSPFHTDDDKGRNIPLYGGVYYALFALPEVTTGQTTFTSIEGTYEFRNMGAVSETAPVDPITDITITKPNLFSAAIIAAPLEVIKRVPSFLYKGQTYEAVGEVIDTYTEVKATNNDNPGDAFENPITMEFTQEIRSTGIFAITFQVPVYAMTGDPSDNNVSLAPVKWYIRPGYNQYQYLLDDGEGAGGMVMLGAGVAGLDWLDIFTVGIGFGN